LENEIQECQDKLNEYKIKEEENDYYDNSLSMKLFYIIINELNKYIINKKKDFTIK